MNTMEYRCPCCGGPLAYGAKSGKLECRTCGNSYDADALDAMHDSAKPEAIHFNMTAEGFDAQEAAQMHAFVCQSCGAELMTEETTTAMQCPYCGSPTILPDRLEGSVKPEWVIPFTVTREEAQKQFETYFKGKKLLPNVFRDSRNRIDTMRMLYVPYWIFDCSASGNAVFEAEKRRVYREGDDEITETEHYIISRAGHMDFQGIPVDASAKLDNQITESLEPFDVREAVPFSPAVLAGAMADCTDVDSAECEERASQRVKHSMERALRDTVVGYSSVTTRGQELETQEAKATPALMPVWLITTQKEGKTYTFAINGQTGQLTCDVPADKKKTLLWGGGVFAGVFAAACALLYLGGMLEDWMVLVAAVVALFAGFVVVAVLIGQLRQATSVDSAGGYAVEDSFELTASDDHYLRTTRTRRKIEQKPDQDKKA